MAKTSCFVKFVTQPGKRDELLASLREMLPTVADEDGTEMYSFHLDKADDNALWLFELYADDAALTTHSSSEAMKTLLGALGGLLGEPPLMAFASPVDAKGFEV
ncbi:MAG: antibiotic biosynthesis monooxygenase [Actinobacteria bacterium]|nr:antibiotic biosynthesis monooxygenase [Actinomycetota bacterium]